MSSNGEALVSVENLTKQYAPLGPMRVQRFFARLGGLQVEGLLPDDVVEDDEDEDLVGEEDEQPQERGAAGRTVIDGVSLQANGGSCVALVGPEGAGKTLLLKLIGGVVPPSSGRIVVRGVVAPALAVLARSLPAKGQTLQSGILHVAAIAGIPPHLVRSRLDEIAEFLELPQLRRTPPIGMTGRRKVEIILAAMLAVEPDIVLLDLPIAPTALGERFLRRLDEVRARGGLVITEGRDVATILPAPDRVVYLDRGRIVAEEDRGPFAAVESPHDLPAREP
jgi:ABC-type polysaccharide/polyol phosphate transport system ATPase subunit